MLEGLKQKCRVSEACRTFFWKRGVEPSIAQVVVNETQVGTFANCAKPKQIEKSLRIFFCTSIFWLTAMLFSLWSAADASHSAARLSTSWLRSLVTVWSVCAGRHVPQSLQHAKDGGGKWHDLEGEGAVKFVFLLFSPDWFVWKFW